MHSKLKFLIRLLTNSKNINYIKSVNGAITFKFALPQIVGVNQPLKKSEGENTDMAEIKDLLGENFKEGMTSDEIVQAIKSNDKIVNLTKGGYVSKNKFDDLSTNLQNLTESTKDYETLKKGLEEYKAKANELTNRENLRNSGVKSEFLDYALFQIEKGKIDNSNPEKLDENVKKWLEENPQYSAAQKQTETEESKKNPAKIILKTAPKNEKAAPIKPWNKYNHSI